MKKIIFIISIAASIILAALFLSFPTEVTENKNNDPGWVISHKTAGLEYPENTIEGFKASLEMDVQAIELDVHVIKNGGVVLHHDPVLSMENCFMNDEKKRIILEQSTIQSLSAIACTNKKLNKKYNLVPLEMFMELYTQTDMSKTLFLEIKVWDEIIENDPAHVGLDIKEMHFSDDYAAAAVLKVLKAYPNAENIILNTFSRSLLLELRRQAGPDSPFEYALIYKGKYSPKSMGILAFFLDLPCYRNCWAPDYKEVRGWMRQNNINIFIPNYPQLTFILFSKNFKKHILNDREGLLVFPWTLNKETEWEEYLSFDFDGILTDRPLGFLNWHGK